MKDCGANIQLRYLETRARVNGNEASGNEEPLVRLRDGARVLE